MSITSPADFLKDLDLEFFRRYRPLPEVDMVPVEYVEPDLSGGSGGAAVETNNDSTAPTMPMGTTSPPAYADADTEAEPARKLDKITSKIVTLGDFIDTDAVSFDSIRFTDSLPPSRSLLLFPHPL